MAGQPQCPGCSQDCNCSDPRRAGYFSNVRGVSAGVYECRVDFGPGYRIYFGKDGDTLVILLGGGTKKRQDKDIQAAHECWKDYKQRKAEERVQCH